ncbi:hypothetical protein [Amycolatopsis magusensis]|uniref:hypothetical protein n=1 Tax=Amycolatopsis magusensis TaxID=882444 RepID=UPI0024A90996|nr:hypothetical protein [Amycolatopsis magusensis]MDI5977890.1 hypothetical protein [Amycolatopsis magusensis]
MARRSEVGPPAGEELVFRASLSEVVRLPWFVAVLGTAIALVLGAIVVPGEDRVDLWLTAAVLVTGAAGGLLWRRLVSGTTADAEGLTAVWIRAADLSWPDVQGLALRARGVFAYDATGRHYLLHHVPPTRRALADLEELWLAGRGAD